MVLYVFTNVYRKQALVDKEPDKSVWRTIYVKVRLAYGQSVFIVGESLHNDAGLTPVLLCAGLPTASHFMIERVAFVCA
jgi:hypothetical protein